MRIALPDATGAVSDYTLTGMPLAEEALPPDSVRTVFAAAHVVANPFADGMQFGPVEPDWEATLAFRRHLAGLGLGIAEAMDTAQRGMGLDWPDALELIRRTRAELPRALVANGCGTDHLDPADAHSVDDVLRAYLEQLHAIQRLDARVILMASRALARVADSAAAYRQVYGAVLAECEHPVILHWLGAMFDPQLAGYWGSASFAESMETVVSIIEENAAKIEGIKLSLLDQDKEIVLRRRLPDGVRMYTGDDFNYPALIAGDAQGFSHALLGIFDPLAPAAARAVRLLGAGDVRGFRDTLDPTVPLARQIFAAPTRHYRTGVVFLAWLNGFQDHFVMLGAAQAMRPLRYFTEVFRHADGCGLLRDPELAVHRMKHLLAVHGVA